MLAVLSLDGSQPCFTAHTLQVNYQVASHACSLAGGYLKIYKESGEELTLGQYKEFTGESRSL